MRAIIMIVMSLVCLNLYAQQEEKLEIEGAIQIGDSDDPSPDPGTIRWTGTDFEGWNGSEWVSLTVPKDYPPPHIDEINVDSVVLLDSVQSFIVPDSQNLHLTTFAVVRDWENPDSSWAQTNSLEVDGIYFSFVPRFGPRNETVFGGGMTITSRNYMKGIGYLTKKKVELFAHDLKVSPYTVPDGKTLIVLAGWTSGTRIGGIEFTQLLFTVFENQTMIFDGDEGGVFIGYLR